MREKILEIKKRAEKQLKEWNYPNEHYIEAQGALMVCDELLEQHGEYKELGSPLTDSDMERLVKVTQPQQQNREYYEKVYIRSEEDLPEEEDLYPVQKKDTVVDWELWETSKDKGYIDVWLRDIDWYLRPLKK